ncbi:MAG: aldehyde dehydrogenase family protein [Candidatus Shapirobacteria bacterium]|nr:aldehyde dehydrogenase family protein [Candidatus Shapirobacteria bacterium]
MKLQSINPNDQTIVGELEVSTEDEIKKQVEKARKTLDSWKNISVEERCLYISKLKDLLNKNKDKLARLMTLEMGKPLQQSVGEIESELEFIEYYAKNGPKFFADESIIENEKDNYKVTYEPYGVCACISPWNFPVSMVTSGVLPAITAGNTVVVKPSEYTSLSQKMVVDLLNETGIPEGVVNLVIGGGNEGKILVDSKIDLVWFTGSTKAGMDIYKKCGEKFIKSLLEMGGSSAGIVMADANMENAIENLYWARFLNCGQVCTAVKRLFVEKSIFEKFTNSFAERVNKAKVGNPLKDNDIGPLVTKRQLEIIKDQIDDAISKGAKVLIGGKQPKDTELLMGNYYLPTILTNVNFDMKVMNEETFGPVISIMPFETEEEAITLANRTEYGLSSEIYTSDLEKGTGMARKIQSGTVAINTDNFFKPECPFGGFKKSGTGREYGKIGMQEFAQVKVIAICKV